MKTLLITGNTYLARKSLASLGCVFSYELGGYVGYETQPLLDTIAKNDLEVSETSFIQIDEAYIVEQKNKRAERKANKYSERATKLEAQAEATEISQQERDFLVLAEPIKIGHHSEKRHRKLIEKSWRTMDKKIELYNEAKEAEHKAKYWAGQKYTTEEVKLDRKAKAKLAFEKALELWKEEHKVGEMYNGWHTSNQLEIAKINKKTITTTTGSKWDIAYSLDFESYMRRANVLLFSEK